MILTVENEVRGRVFCGDRRKLLIFLTTRVVFFLPKWPPMLLLTRSVHTMSLVKPTI